MKSRDEYRLLYADIIRITHWYVYSRKDADEPMCGGVSLHYCNVTKVIVQ